MALQQGKAYQQEAESVKFDLQDRRNAVRAQAQREKERAEQERQKLQQQRAAAAAAAAAEAAAAAAAARRPAGRAAEPKPKAKPVEDDDVVEILDSDDEVRCSCTGGAGLMGCFSADWRHAPGW